MTYGRVACPYQKWDRFGTFRGYCRLAWAHEGPHEVPVVPVLKFTDDFPEATPNIFVPGEAADFTPLTGHVWEPK